MILTLKIWRWWWLWYWWFEDVVDGGDVDDFLMINNDYNCDDDADGVFDNIGLMMLIIMHMTIFY